MAETYDESAELDNARDLLCAAINPATNPSNTLLSDANASTAPHEGNVFSGFSADTAADTAIANPEPLLLVPKGATSTVPVDDFLTTQQSTPHEANEEEFPVAGYLGDEVDDLGHANAEEGEGEEGSHTSSTNINGDDTPIRTKRRVEETAQNITPAEQPHHTDHSIDEMIGLKPVEKEMDEDGDDDENINLLQFANLSAHARTEHRAEDTFVDLSSVFPVSRVKKLFRAGWGDGNETLLDVDGTEVDDGASTAASMSKHNTCPMVSADAIAAIAHAAALFVDDMVKRSADQTARRGKRTIAYDDVSLAVATMDRLAFLQDVVPPAFAPLSGTHAQTRAGNAEPEKRAAQPQKPPAAQPKQKAPPRKTTARKTAPQKEQGQTAGPQAPNAAAAKLDISSFFKKGN